MSLDLISILASDKDVYNRFSRFIKPETLSKEAATLVTDIGEYYKAHPSAHEVEWEQFSEWFRIVQHSAWKEDKLNNFDKVFTRLASHEVTEVAESIIEKCVTQDYCQRIADITLRGAEGHSINLDDVAVLLEDYNQETDRVSKLDSYIVTDDLEELIHSVVDEGFRWRMDFLNKSIGNLRKGKLVCFAARPNTGKTTWLAAEATYMASQMGDDEYVLWFNNEEAGGDVKLRIIQAALQTETANIRANPKKSLDDYKAAIAGNADKIKVIDKADLNTKDVEEFLRTHNVKLIIFDQLWKVHGYERSSATDTARLGAVYQWAREIAKKYAPVITVHQVKTEGEGVEYLTPSMLYLSGTVIQGEVDSLILMGRNYNAGQENNRFIIIGKNKGAYGPDVDITLREGRTAVMIVPETAEFIE